MLTVFEQPALPIRVFFNTLSDKKLGYSGFAPETFTTSASIGSSA